MIRRCHLTSSSLRFEDANDQMILNYVCEADKVLVEMVTGYEVYEMAWAILGVYWRQAFTEVYGDLGNLVKKKERRKEELRIKERKSPVTASAAVQLGTAELGGSRPGQPQGREPRRHPRRKHPAAEKEPQRQRR